MAAERALSPLLCREWEELHVGGSELTETEAGRLHALAERAGRRLKLGETGVLVRTRSGLKAQQVVGVLTVPGRTLEILPKIDGESHAVRDALVRMLAVVHGFRVADGATAGIARQPHDLLELLVRLFAGRLRNAVLRGMPRRYIAREEDMGMLRGRLDVVRQFARHAVRPDRLACRFDELSEDTPLNRVLKAAVSRLALMTRSAANARLLSELAARLESAGDPSRPLEEPVRLDRTNAAFHDLYRLAVLFLKGEWQGTAAGRPAGLALLFPMNDLFEAFVGRSLQRTFARPPESVRLQASGQHALTDGTGDNRLFALQPDAVVRRPGECVIIDTKWKALDPGSRKLGVVSDDIYQMLAYCRAYRASRGILLYPRHGETGHAGGIIARWKARGPDPFPVSVASVDVGRPNEVPRALAEIVEDVWDGAGKDRQIRDFGPEPTA